MIRQHFIIQNGTTWACEGCGATFLEGWVEHPATCPMMRPVICKHDLVLESCAECFPASVSSPEDQPAGSPHAGQGGWEGMHYTAQDAQARRRFGPWIIAQYTGGMCPGCGERRIMAGHFIRADDDLGDFVCKACGLAEGGPDPEES